MINANVPIKTSSNFRNIDPTVGIFQKRSKRIRVASKESLSPYPNFSWAYNYNQA